MHYKEKYQDIIIRENCQRRFERRKSKARKKSLSQNIKVKVKKYLTLFLETSSIHGLNHLVVPRRHSCEVFLWLVMVIVSIIGTVYLSRTTWIRYQSSPTVISMERDMFAWNTTFPSVTICLHDKIDPEKLEVYLSNSKEVDKEKLRNFIISLANATFKNFDAIPEYDGIEPEQYLNTILNVSPTFNPAVVIGASGVNPQITSTVTEMGLCHSINSQVAAYNSPDYRTANRWDIVRSNTSFFAHPLDGDIFAFISTFSRSYNAYVHGPLEFPDISTKFQHSPSKLHMKLYVYAVAVYTSPEAASLRVAQRRCHFPHENNLKHNPVYSYTMCRMECRIKLCLEYCECIPYFYRRIGNEKICDVKGLHCLMKHKDVLLDLRFTDGNKVSCECFPICDDVNYIVQSSTLSNISSIPVDTTFQWGINTYPRVRYKRDIIFGFTDVLVAVGGMAGLFLGCSVLGFMEILYFLTLRLICYTTYNTTNK